MVVLVAVVVMVFCVVRALCASEIVVGGLPVVLRAVPVGRAWGWWW